MREVAIVLAVVKSIVFLILRRFENRESRESKIIQLLFSVK